MKRASKIITSRTMRGSGPALPPNQEAMPRAGGPTGSSDVLWPRPPLGPEFQAGLYQVPTLRPGAWARSSGQRGVS